MTQKVTTIAHGAVPLKTQIPIYLTGLFSNSLADVASVVLPIWLANDGMTTAGIGLVLGVRHLLPFLFAIHGGALMDQVGARQLMMASSLMSAVMLLLFPTVGWIPAIIVLQMLNGYGSSMSWIGAQAYFGRLLAHSPTYAGRFAFSLRIGSFIGPPLAGVAWDMIGVWGAFGILSLWAAGTAISALFIPQSADGPAADRRSLSWNDVMPRGADYRDAFVLACEPAMKIVLIITVMRIAASSIQDTFYPVWLASIGLPATQIGLLITASSALAAASSLWVGPVSRLMNPLWVLIWTAMGSIFFVSITPSLDSLALLMTAAALRGLCMGLSQPLMLSILADAAGPGFLARGAALRTTANRVAASLTPMTMGSIASVAGLAASFHIIGAILLAGVGLVGFYVKTHPAVTEKTRE
jgi:MFS family permease